MRQRTFIPKKLIDGRTLGRKGLYIGIPQKGYEDCKILVFYKDRARIIDDWKSAETFRKVPDMWNKGYYLLGYFKWSDEKLPPLKQLPQQLNLL